MAELSVLYPLVRPWAPAPDPALELAARQVVRDFCRRTRALQLWLDPIEVVAEARTVVLPSIPEFDIVAPTLVRCSGVRLQPKTPDALDDMSPFEDWRTYAPAKPNVFVADELDPTILTLYPAPSGAEQLQVKVAIRPSGAFTTMPQSLLRWDTVLASGMKAILFAMRDTPFFSADNVPVEEARYADGVAQARLDVLRGTVDAPAHVAMMPMA